MIYSDSFDCYAQITSRICLLIGDQQPWWLKQNKILKICGAVLIINLFFPEKEKSCSFHRSVLRTKGSGVGVSHAFLSSEMPTTLQLSIPLHCLDIFLLTCFRNLKYLSLAQSILFFWIHIVFSLKLSYVSLLSYPVIRL